MKRNLLKISVVTAMLLSTGAYAGKIIGVDAGTAYNETIPPTQYGFGGWNFDNVDVRIVDVDDFSTKIGDFNTTDGTYDPMGVSESFESDIKDINYSTGVPVVGSTIMGHLHGKDWPVGEPAGIKIINDDDKTSNGKPYNCIMTTSYLDTGFLDSGAPKPVICSSPWQTHKRFKINLLPTTVVGVDPVIGGDGQSVDIVFNLDDTDTNTTVRGYQVLQKINNYTGMRLDGYTVEVLDENGSKNDALTLSLGIGENNTVDPTEDIWDITERANFSHGLWGPYQKVGDVVRFENGFFDFKRSYYPVTLDGTNQSISYAGLLEGGNYQSIFGNWLPSIWAPYGVFHDDDQDPNTDAALMAFYGTAPGHTEDAWYKRTVVDIDPNDNIDPVYTWVAATDADFATWSGDWYSVGLVEDTLNLGLNYIVQIGENAAIGKTFTIRITPHVGANDQTPPTYVGTTPTIPVVTPPPSTGGGGGGCTYNPNSKNFDMTFLMLMALGLLYPFRRRLFK